MGWQAILPERVPVRGDSVDDVDCSTLWLLEDGVAIGPPHAVHDDIVAIGKGRYSHWGQGFWFSSSDNSDPNTNGRAYRIAWDKSVRAVGDAVDRCDPIKDMLGEILRRRGVDRIAYFHTDHFEPFPAGQGRDRWIKGLRRFATLTRGRRFGGRLSLFYTPLIVNAPRLRRGLLHVAREPLFRAVEAPASLPQWRPCTRLVAGEGPQRTRVRALQRGSHRPLHREYTSP